MPKPSSYQAASRPREEEALVSKGAGDFTPAATRPWRDTAWLYWFLLNTAVVLLWGGILSTQAGPPVDLKLQSSCAAGSGRRLLANGGARRELEGAAATLCIFACVCAVPVALGFLYLLRNEGFAKVAVYGALGAQVLVSGIAGLWLCAIGDAVWSGIFLLAYSCIFALCVWCYTSQLKLCVKLLAVAALSLGENLYLVPATLLSFCAGATLWVPLAYFAIEASRIGVALPNPGAQASPSSPGLCEMPAYAGSGYAPAPAPSTGGNVTYLPTDCCEWAMAGGSIAFLCFAGLYWLWSLFILFEVRSFTVAHVTCRWYHNPAGVPLPGNPVSDALRLSFGPASGSLCMGGAVLTVAELLRLLADAVQSEEQGFGIMCLLEMCVAGLLQLAAEVISFMTRFATIRMRSGSRSVTPHPPPSVTGESFYDAARRSQAVFGRNFLNSVAVWSFPPMVLHLLCFTAALLFGLLALAIFSVDVFSLGVAGTMPLMLKVAVFLGCSFLFWLPLSYTSCILLNVMDTVYYCFATDMDRQVVTRREVHELFPLVPGVRVVVDPDGSVGGVGRRVGMV